MRKYFLLISLLAASYSVSSQNNTLIKSGEIWPDTQGKHINAHGGGIVLFKGTYYWFGESRLPRGETDRTNYGVGCYSSKDLVSWKNEGLALRVIYDTASLLQPGCVIERPKVIYNKKTDKFVMWFHHELKGQGYRAAMTGVAVSDNITGPYRYIRSLRTNAGTWPVNFTNEQINYSIKESELKSWKPNPGRLAVSDKITGEWKSLGNPCRGTEEENKITFGSQSTFVLPINAKKNIFVFMGDRWTPQNLADSRYIWLPVEWENDLPVIRWKKEWDISGLK